MRRIERRPQARFDLLAMYNYVADHGGEVRAERYLRRLDGAIHDLSRHPLMGRARPELGEAIRSFPFEDYVIFYLPLADGVDLVRVIHAALDLERAWSPQDDQPPAQ